MSDMAAQKISHCERCGKLLDENDAQVERCQRCGRPLSSEQVASLAHRQVSKTAAPAPTTTAAEKSEEAATGGNHPPAVPSRTRQTHTASPIETYTDEIGAFFISLNDGRRYEFRRGAGCTRNDITATMVQLVTDYMDTHTTTVALTTFFAMLGSALESERRSVVAE